MSQDFLDLPGASGAAYRFRLASLDALPATAGNLVVARLGAAGPKVLLCVSALSLAQARRAAAEALKAGRGAALYIRLNVARAVRDAEHADIVAATHPAQELADLG